MIQGQQAPAPFQSASLYVGDLDPEATEGILFEMFNRVGPVASIRVCRDAVTRRSLGYAYVNFHNVQDAERALDTMNFTNIKERPCRIMWSQRDPRLRKSGLGNVFVKNLPESVDNKTLFDTFSVFGNILSCKVANDPESGKSKGYGYIHYETAEAATEAITKFNGNSMDDQEVFVGHFVRRQDRPNQTQWTNLYVKQFYNHWDEQKLTELFAPFGNLVSLYLARDADKKSRGFAFVNYASHEEAEEALKGLNGKKFEDTSDPDAPPFLDLYVNRAQKKGERQEEIKRRLAQIQQEIVNKYQGMNLYVKNLDDAVTDDLFRDTFAKFGVITSARIMRDPVDNTSKGFGFVCFSSHEEATAAITDLHGKMLLNKPIFVTLHQRREQRSAALQATYSSRSRMSFPPSPANMPMPYGMPMYAPQQGGQPRFPMQQYGYPNQVPNQPFQNRGGPRGAPNGYFPMNPSYAPPQMQSPGQQQQQGFGRRPMSGGPVQSQGQPGGFPQGQPQQRIPRNNIPQQGQRSGPGGPGGPGRGYPQMPQQLGPGGMGGPKPRMPVQFNAGVRNSGMLGQGAVMQQGMMQPMANPSMAPLDDQLLASADPQVQKNMIGERLYPLIYVHQPQLAGKITGMLLEMDNAELLNLIESPDALLHKIQEALIVLQTHAADSVDDDQQ